MFYATGLTGWQRAAMDTPPVPPMPAATPPAATPVVAGEKQSLEIEVNAIQSQLDALRTRLAEIEAETT